VLLGIQQRYISVISDFCRQAYEISAHVGNYGVYGGNSLTTLWDKLSTTSQRDKKFNLIGFVPLKMGLIDCPETSVRDHKYTLRKSTDLKKYMFCVPQPISLRRWSYGYDVG